MFRIHTRFKSKMAAARWGSIGYPGSFISVNSALSSRATQSILWSSHWSQKKTGSSFYCLKNEAKKLQPLTRTQKAAGPRDESTRDHPAWIVKCKVKDFWATWRYAFNMRLIYGPHFSYQYQVGSYQYGADGFKNLGSKTVGSSI